MIVYISGRHLKCSRIGNAPERPDEEQSARCCKVEPLTYNTLLTVFAHQAKGRIEAISDAAVKQSRNNQIQIVPFFFDGDLHLRLLQFNHLGYQRKARRAADTRLAGLKKTPLSAQGI